MESRATIGDWVRRQRKVLDLTQAALASRVGCAAITIRKIEQEERRPSRQMAELLAEQLTIPEIERAAFLRVAQGEYLATRIADGDRLQPPAFLNGADLSTRGKDLPFVGRARQLAQLETYLATALSGRGGVVFITGEAGRGKTMLMAEFARRAQAVHAELVMASGSCDAFAGPGDPYLPFRDVMGLLSGDVEGRWLAGSLSREQTQRLWTLLPHTVAALTDHGPDLIDVVVSGGALPQRASVHTPGRADWRTRLHAVLEQRRSQPNRTDQRQLFEQYTQVLRTLAAQHPLLLLLDDLQWADNASINLLFHLGQRLAGSPILIVCAYRPSEVACESGAGSHPLGLLVQEFRRRFGDVEIDLSQLTRAEERAFVDALLDSKSNRLGETFRQTLFWRTHGHPLFTVELLQDMRERGGLMRDESDWWVEGPALDWDRLPARVEAVIAGRIGRLSPALQEVLKIASVEGETFAAEVVARVLGVEVREVVGQLSGPLSRSHRLVREEGARQVGVQLLSQFRFRHVLFQRYLYDSLGGVERAYLHAAVGEALEELYGDEREEVAVQLTRHFQMAGQWQKTVVYLYHAGERAVRLSAHKEGVRHLGRGVALLETLPDSRERAERELPLQVALGASLRAIKGVSSAEVGAAYERAHALAAQLGDGQQRFLALMGLSANYITQGRLQATREIAEQCIALGRTLGKPSSILEGGGMLGIVLAQLGQWAAARAYLAQSVVRSEFQRDASRVFLYGQHYGIGWQRHLAIVLWHLGYPGQALDMMNETVAVAQTLSPHDRAIVHVWSAWLHQFRREAQCTRGQAEACIALSRKQEFPYWLTYGTSLLGWALAQQGEVERGIVCMQEALAERQVMNARLHRPVFLAMLAEAYGLGGQPAEGLACLDEALVKVEETGERFSEAELHRRKGELLLLQNPTDPQAEKCFRQAIEIARSQQAKSLELRAAVNLSRLWQRQGKRGEARELLAEIYGWFSEGFDTPDLQEAQVLLQELG